MERLVSSREKAFQAAKLRFFGEFATPLGRAWRNRLDASEAYYRRNSSDWDYLRNLQFDMQTISLHTWATTVATGYSVILGQATDTWGGNPETWAQVKGPGDPTGDIAKAFRDIVNTIHKDADTGGIFRKCLLSEGFAGFGGHWAYGEQTDEEYDAPVIGDDKKPVLDDDGKPKTKKDWRAREQRYCGDYVEPWDLRFDPDGRDWRYLKDHKYLVRKYYKTLQQVLELPFITKNGAAMVKAWGANRRVDLRFNADVSWRDISNPETDPGYMIIPMYEIWDKVDHQIIHIPVASDFDIGTYPMPREWRRADCFPLTFVGFNWEAPDRYKTRGFYPVPTLRLIAPQVENINRLEGLYMEAATSNVIKFLTIKGLLDEDEIEKIDNDRNRLTVSVDITKLREYFPAIANDPGVDLRKLFTMIPYGEKMPVLFEYEKAIDYEFTQISRVIGQGSQNRFSMPQEKSATAAAGLIDAMNRRARTKSELAANIFDEITEKFWLLLKTRQTLPIDYLEATDVPDLPGTWKQFTDLSKVRNLNLVFTHRVGSNLPRDPLAEAAARNQAGQMLLQIFSTQGDLEKVDAVAKWMLEPQNFRDLAIFNNKAKDLAKQYAVMVTELGINPKLATDPDFADQKQEIASQLVAALLTPKEMQQVAATVQQRMESGATFAPRQPGGGGPQQQPGQTGSASLPSPATGGEQAYAGAESGGATAGAAAAGRTNIRAL